MPAFLAENNLCGQTILQLVSKGNAIIAELLRLKDYIPQIYRLSTKEELQTYGEIILDFNYFKNEELQNNKIENNQILQDLDDEFKENNIEMINRFYSIFESIHTYITELNQFLDEVDEGFYIHQTLDTIFADMEGKQLLCEALYLYGLMLLFVDTHFEGIIRERMLVSYYRYTPQRSDTQSRIDDVCKLLRDTGFNTTRKPNNYPEDYFQRIPIKSSYIDMTIGHLRSDDIYNQLSIYPLPKHRSTALAHQASMLYVCLFFAPNILHSQTAIMREIVDKYFPDNWIISIYMGHIINLSEIWKNFKAAKLALNNTLEIINIKSYANSNGGTTVANLLKSTNIKLKDGNITKENLLKDVTNIINLLRDCNVTLRWLMLHTIANNSLTKNKNSKQLHDLVVSESKLEQVQLFKLLLNTAQLEQIVKEFYKRLLEKKDEQFLELKIDSYKSLIELSEVFSGAKPLTRIKKNDSLERWFLAISQQVDGLQADEDSSRKIIQLIQALEEVQEFHQLETNLQVIQFLQEIRKNLHQMLRNLDIKEDVLINLQIIGDLSYAWELIKTFTQNMQFGIKKEPTLVIKLRAIFLKLASALEVPLLRINQAHSHDLISVSQYYSSELEIYVREVLQIIPKMMFEKMARIIEIQTSVLKELPTRLDKDKLKDYAQLNERFEFAELTHSISVFSQGMKMMKSTLVGVICLDPKKLLEDGIRKELVQYISKALHTGLIFSQKFKIEELEQRLTVLGRIMDGYKRSFEYIQDYININGLKIWQEEVTRIINYNVEQECNGFLRSKIYTWESTYQSRYVPIPLYPSIDNRNANFIGRLAHEIIRLTEPKHFVYLDHTSSWYDIKSKKSAFNKETIGSISSALEISGLVGLDKLFSFMIISKLQKLSDILENKNSTKNTTWFNIISNIQEDMLNLEKSPNPVKIYQTCVNRTTKIWTDFLDALLLVGQLQLMRNLIVFHLNKSCKFNAKNLEFSLQTLNKALLNDIKTDGEYSPSELLMGALSPYFDYSGMNDPFKKIYITSKFKDSYSTVIFMLVIANLPKMFFVKQVVSLNKKNVDQIDGTAIAVGIHTLLKQFHKVLNREFIKLLCEFIINYTKNAVSSDIPIEVSLAMNFLEIYTNYSEQSREAFKENMPEEIHHSLQTLI